MGAAKESRAQANEYALVGWLALLPLAVLAWPFAGSPVRTALEPELAGAAVLALAALPAIGFVALTRRSAVAFGLTPLFVYALVGFASLRLRPPSDTLEADRALLLLLGALALALVGASTRRGARERFVIGVHGLALLLLGAALFDREHRFAGVLQNTGATSEAALAGALVGAWSFATARGVARTLGFVALAAFAFYVGLAPVFAGLVSLAAALVLGALRAPGERRGFALALGVALLAFGAGRAVEHFGATPTSATAGVSNGTATASNGSATVPVHTGGVAVRMHLWRAIPSFVRDHGALGAGPGQFRASFPPYRAPEEIELERRALGAETEVEHAHNDWLQGWCDAGWVGGLAWLAFLAWTALNALRALREPSRDRAALALVALGLLANAALRAPLLWNPASAACFFFAAGALASRPNAGTASRSGAILPWLSVALLVAFGTTAVSVLRLTRELDHAKAAIDPAKALERRDDSVLAWSLSARELERQNAPATARRAWQRVLDHRPFHVEALVQLGFAALRRGDASEARRVWARALAIDPTQPAATRNLYVLALRSSERDELDAALATARATLSNADLVDLAVNATLAGREFGFVALQVLVPDLATLDGSALEESVRALNASGQTKLADALDCRLAQVSARDFAAAGAWHDSVRLYRQALRLSKRHGEDVGAPLRLEFAAALARDGKPEDGKQELAGSSWSPDELALLPEWAGTALVEFGLLAR